MSDASRPRGFEFTSSKLGGGMIRIGAGKTVIPGSYATTLSFSIPNQTFTRDELLDFDDKYIDAYDEIKIAVKKLSQALGVPGRISKSNEILAIGELIFTVNPNNSGEFYFGSIFCADGSPEPFLEKLVSSGIMTNEQHGKALSFFKDLREHDKLEAGAAKVQSAEPDDRGGARPTLTASELNPEQMVDASDGRPPIPEHAAQGLRKARDSILAKGTRKPTEPDGTGFGKGPTD